MSGRMYLQPHQLAILFLTFINAFINVCIFVHCFNYCCFLQHILIPGWETCFSFLHLPFLFFFKCFLNSFFTYSCFPIKLEIIVTKPQKSFDGIWIGLALNCKIRWGKIDMLTVQSLSVQELVYHLSLFTWALFYAHPSFPVIFFIRILHI